MMQLYYVWIAAALIVNCANVTGCSSHDDCPGLFYCSIHGCGECDSCLFFGSSWTFDNRSCPSKCYHEHSDCDSHNQCDIYHFCDRWNGCEPCGSCTFFEEAGSSSRTYDDGPCPTNCRKCRTLEIQNAQPTSCLSDGEANTECSVACNSGYQLSGGESTVTCYLGLWSKIPSCVEIPCGIPVVQNSNSAASCGTLYPGDSCDIRCNEGYEMINLPSTIQCMLGPAYTTFPACGPVPCPAIDILASNSRSCGVSVGDECRIECDPGYLLKGVADIRCEFGGTWSQLPFCERIVCPVLGMEHSTSLVDCNEIPSGNPCYFSCNEGFEKISWNEIDASCSLLGEWTIYAQCNQIYCEALQIGFSDSFATCNATKARDVCSFGCNDGYQIPNEGNAVATCDIEGRWTEHISACEEIIKCDAPFIDHSFADTNCSDWLSNSLCKFSCEENYDVFDDPVVEDGDKTIFCNEQGEWEYLPKCYLVLVAGRFPEETIEEEDIEFQSQANSAVKNVIDNVMTDMMFGDVPFEDVVLHSGNLDPYTWFIDDDGKYEDGALAHKINRLDRQPHGADKVFYDNYNSLLWNGLKLKGLNGSDVTELENLGIQRGVQLDEFNGIVDELFQECTSPGNVETYGDDIVGCMEDLGYIEQQIRYEELQALILKRKNEILHDVVQDIRDKLDNDMVDGYHDWCAKPTPNGVVDLFSLPSTPQLVEVSISETNVEQDISVEDVFRPTFAAYRGGQFITVKIKKEQLNADIQMEFNKWTRINVSPGLWYDNRWMDAAQDPRYIDDGWTIDQESDPKKIPAWGPNGILNSVAAQLVVAQDIKIKASGTSSLVRELRTMYADAESVRLGNLCSGKACATSVNVILDTTATVPSLMNTTEEYFASLITQIRAATYRNSSLNNTIAILGSERSMNDDLAGILFQMSSRLDIPVESYYFYEGQDKIERFFQDLESGSVDPQIIWFSATDNINDLDQDESDVLTKYATLINDYASSGGGLIAHGYPHLAFGWLSELLPNLTMMTGCNTSNIEISHAGRALLSQSFTTQLLQALPCVANFDGDFGNLEAFVADSSGRFFVLGAFGGITRGSSPLEISDTATEVHFEDSSSLEELQFELNFVFDRPVIIATYAPRLPHILAYAECVNDMDVLDVV